MRIKRQSIISERRLNTLETRSGAFRLRQTVPRTLENVGRTRLMRPPNKLNIGSPASGLPCVASRDVVTRQFAKSKEDHEVGQKSELGAGQLRGTLACIQLSRDRSLRSFGFRLIPSE